ncbi:hypothetical protein HYY69_02875 [Candidatus Woesearchaeota archaeon]|nr:hypothetical protein [Candidatus Woesearchaeota archaeon]
MIETVKTSLEQKIAEGYVVYVATINENRDIIPAAVFGYPVEFIDIAQQEQKPFCQLLSNLDGKAHGDTALASDGWVMLDCGLLPSAYIGLGKQVDDCDEETKQQLGVASDYEGIVPFSEYCIIPRIVPGSWISHTLAAIKLGSKLGFLTKVIGLKLFNVGHYLGVAQYTNRALRTHTLLGDLTLKTAVTNMHDFPDMTFIYEQWVFQGQLGRLQLTHDSNAEQQYDFLLDPFDEQQKKQLQQRLEQGAVYHIVAPGHIYIPERPDKPYIPMVKK